MPLEVAVSGVPGSRLVAGFEWVEGAPAAAHLDQARARAMGTLCGALHAHSLAHPDPELDAALPRLTTLIDRKESALLDHLADEPAPRRRVFEEFISRSEALLDRFADAPLLRCHADLHPWNVLRTRRGRYTVIDFDDSAMTWPAYDLGIAKFYLHVARTKAEDTPSERKLIWRGFCEGYAQSRPLSEDPRAIDAFVIVRQLVLLDHLLGDPRPHLQAIAPGYLDRAETRLHQWLEQLT